MAYGSVGEIVRRHVGRGLKIILIVLLGVSFMSGGGFYLFPGLIVDAANQVMRWQAGVRKSEVQVDGDRWVYLEGGEGETILFVHGFGMDKDRWGPFLKCFNGSHRMIVPDLPGFGETSPLSSGGYDIPSQVERLNRFVEKIGLKSFHLVGISMGGYIAAYYAGEYPEKVKSLALMAPAGVASRIPSYAWLIYRKQGNIVLLYRTVEAFEDLMSLIFYRPPLIPGPIKRHFAARGAAHYPLYQKILRDMERGGMFLLEGRLHKIKAGTLILWGAKDAILHPSGAEKFLQGLRQSRVVILEECGHVPYFERPRETLKAYEDFLSGLS